MCIDKTTGKEIWRSQAYKPAYGSPIAFQFKNKTSSYLKDR